MLNVKKFFTGKTITVLVMAVVILGLLITAVLTGTVHNTMLCADCDGIMCRICGATGEVEIAPDVIATCPACCETCGGTGISQAGSLWALLPAVIAIALALITKEVYSSLFIGILSGAILASDFKPLETLDVVVNTGFIDAVSGTAGIFIFLIELGIIVALVNKAGGSKAFGNWAQTHVKTKVGAALCTFVLGVLIFIDDYFNCLTVGSVMRPVTDKHKISRSKLSFLIDATAAPICMIAPISSWAAAVSQYAADGKGLHLFITAIPFNFYSILTLVFVVATILMKFDFGPMRKHEFNALKGDLFSGAKVEGTTYAPCEKGKVIDLLLPIVLLIVTCMGAIYYVGHEEGLNLIDSIANTDATVALPWGGLISLVVIMIYLVIRKVISLKETFESIPKGFIAMVPAILILTFATALKNITGILGADVFVGTLMTKAAWLKNFLPAIVFLVACLLAFATGTSWGTFGILIPIVDAMFPIGNDPIGVVCMSACLAGAVCGDHCSPISDTTIMSSAGAECEHINHVSTQLPYAIFVAVVSFVCYVIAGFVPLWYVMLPLSIVIMVGCLFAFKAILKKRQAAQDELWEKEWAEKQANATEEA